MALFAPVHLPQLYIVLPVVEGMEEAVVLDVDVVVDVVVVMVMLLVLIQTLVIYHTRLIVIQM